MHYKFYFSIAFVFHLRSRPSDGNAKAWLKAYGALKDQSWHILLLWIEHSIHNSCTVVVVAVEAFRIELSAKKVGQILMLDLLHKRF